MADPHTFALAASGWRAEIAPGVGGSLASLTLDDVPVLRSARAGSADPTELACFPLVPFANRVDRGLFSWQGTDISLKPNHLPEVHALHGSGWQAEWEVMQRREFKASMRYRHDGCGPAPFPSDPDRWPWAFEAEQRVRLGERGCAITLDVTNCANVPMPAGLGLHPYFRRRSETRLRFRSNGIFLVDELLVPTGEFAASDHFADFSHGAALPDRMIDHCFVAWDGEAVLEDALGTIRLSAQGAPYLHVYAPAGADFVCLEPVSHMPDALNQDPGGVTSLPPGCTASLRVWIEAELA